MISPSLPLRPVLVVLASLLAWSSAINITRFDIVNADTNQVVRTLQPNDTLSFRHPIAFIAVVPEEPARVTFTEPFFHVEHISPFSLPGDRPRNVFKELDLSPGRHTLSAFADAAANSSLTLSFTILPPDYPSTGPLPTSVAPAYATGVVPQPVPTIQPSCLRADPPYVAVQDVKRFETAPRTLIHLTIRVDWCISSGEPGNQLRVRVLSYDHVVESDGRVAQSTTVLYAVLHTNNVVTATTQLRFQAPCRETMAYVEACAQRPSEPELCGTSGLHLLPGRTPVPPTLVSRPAKNLTFAPGDRPVVRYAIEPQMVEQWAESGDIADAGLSFDIAMQPSYMLSVMAVASDGYFLGASDWTAGNVVEATLPLRSRGTRGLRARDDAAEVFLRYKTTDCLAAVGALREGNSSIVRLDRTLSRPVEQGNRLPEIGLLAFPPTVYGSAATLQVEVASLGNGRMPDGGPVELQFQWLKHDRVGGRLPPFPSEIAGATGSSLLIERVICSTRSGLSCDALTGCDGQEKYSVMVCNLFGCVYSNVVETVVLPPSDAPAEHWDEELCIFELL